MTAPFLITGAAGFIGAALCEKLLAAGAEVVGIDNLNDYYDPALKLARLARLEGHPGFRFEKLDFADADGLDALQRPSVQRRQRHQHCRKGDDLAD